MTKLMKYIILKTFAVRYGHSLLAKLKSVSILGLIASVPLTLIDRIDLWYIDNETYVLWVLFAIASDHLVGSLYHAFWKRDFSLKENIKGLLIKLTMVVVVGLLFEGLGQIINKAELIKSYLLISLRVAVFLYPTMSVLFNVYEMTKKKFPPSWVMEKLKSFQATGDISDLKRNKDENSINK